MSNENRSKKIRIIYRHLQRNIINKNEESKIIFEKIMKKITEEKENKVLCDLEDSILKNRFGDVK